MHTGKVWNYKGELLTLREISNITGLKKPTLYGWLTSLSSDVDIYPILLSKSQTLSERKYYVYRGRRVSRHAVCKSSKISGKTLDKIASENNLSDSDDVAPFIAKYKLSKSWIYKGDILSKQEIANITGVNVTTIQDKLKGVPKGTDVTSIVDSRVPSKWYFNGKLLRAGTIGKEIGVTGRVVKRWLIDIPVRTDVTQYIRDCTLRVNIRGIRFKSITDVCLFLNTGYHVITQELLDEYNFDVRVSLGADKASRSTWIIDDLWEYECPVCHKKLLLTTDEIINHDHGSICKEAAII